MVSALLPVQPGTCQFPRKDSNSPMLRARGSGRFLIVKRNVPGSKDALGSSEHRAVSEDKRRLWSESWDLKAIVFMAYFPSLETRLLLCSSGWSYSPTHNPPLLEHWAHTILG